MKNYADLDLAITLDDVNDPEEDSILAGIAIPSKFHNAFIHDVEQPAVAKYGGATFEELMEKDDNASMDAAIHTGFEEKKRSKKDPIEADFEVIEDKSLLS